MDINMNWNRLKDMRCPDCSAVLIANKADSFIRCSLCNFKVREERFNQIMNDMYTPKVEEVERDNQAELNNL